MGVVQGISYNEFPQGSGNEGRCLFKDFPFGKKIATIVREDASAPFDTIYCISQGLDRNVYDVSAFLYVSQHIIDAYHDRSEMQNLTSLAKSKHSYEGKRVRICFNYQTDFVCEGICVFDRGPSMVLHILTGPHAGKYVSAHECQYSLMPDSEVAKRPLRQIRYISAQRARTLRKRGESVWWDSEHEKYAWEFWKLSSNLFPWQRMLIGNILRSFKDCTRIAVVEIPAGVGK